MKVLTLKFIKIWVSIIFYVARFWGLVLNKLRRITAMDTVSALALELEGAVDLELVSARELI